MPVAGLLNESAAVAVPVNALASTPEDAGRAVRDGFKTVKLKAVKDPLAAAYTAIAARAAMGSGSILRMDANGAWTLDEALTFADAAVAAQIEFIEQPLAVGDHEGMTAFRRRCRMPLAVDESVRTAADVGRVGAAQAADLVILKPQFLGGWRNVKQAVQLARTCGLEPLITTAIDGSIGRAFATHMAAACNLALRANGLATGQLLVADLTSEPLTPNKGSVMVRERPGLGIGTLGG
jgi:o-succinylbenzoate synthase